MGEAQDPRLTGRALFLLGTAIVLGVVLFTAVLRPAVERGGATELIVLAAVVAVILLVERWLRTR